MWTPMAGNMSPVHMIVAISLVSVAFAGTVPKKGPPNCDPNTGIGCLPSPDDCPQGCVCNKTDVEMIHVVEEVEEDTIVEERPSAKVEYKLVKTVTNYGSAGISDENKLGVEDSLETILHEKVERVFRGIMLSAALFIICASVCVFSVCLYCCHIRNSDRKLKQDIEALAKKLKVDVKKAGPSKDSKPTTDPIGESCNVVVQDANVMCV